MNQPKKLKMTATGSMGANNTANQSAATRRFLPAFAVGLVYCFLGPIAVIAFIFQSFYSLGWLLLYVVLNHEPSLVRAPFWMLASYAELKFVGLGIVVVLVTTVMTLLVVALARQGGWKNVRVEAWIAACVVDEDS